MDFILPLANEYAEYNSSVTDLLLQEIHTFTLDNHAESHMISGPVQGNLLSMLSRMIQPKRILEIGTFTGYSAICLAKGLSSDGVIHTIELRKEDAAIAQGYFDRSEHALQIKLHMGDARDLLQALDEDWNLVFIDADKTGYLDYYGLLIEKVKPGTFFIIDNVFFHGEVLNEKISGKNAKAIAAFNAFIREDERVEKVILTVRDGLSILLKK